MNRRRRLLLALAGAALAAPIAAFAQRPYRVGFLASEKATEPSQAIRLEALRAALRDAGYVEGRNIVIDQRWADGRYERLPALVAELAALNADVIVTSGTKATMAAREGTATIPIVMGGSSGALELGFTTNLARPSGNVTGWMNLGGEIGSKLVELLKEAAPRIAHVAYLVNPADPPTALRSMQDAAGPLKVKFSVAEAREPREIASAFDRMVGGGCDAVVVQADTLFSVHVKAIADLALKHRMPSSSSLNDMADAGGLLSYGPDRLEGYRRAAYFIDALRKGRKPADLPIERPTRMELVINTATAKTLGVAIPRSLAVQARLI
jgi:ABC-type uncharacterized transport system substrate-binding protein